MKTKITAELSQRSLKEAIKLINNYKENYKKGISNSIKELTLAMYESVKHHCYDQGIQAHTSNIYYDFDEQKNIGRVWTDDDVIIFNEMGTGIVGANAPHPSPNKSFKSWKYDVNEHGEKGWVYPKEDGTFGWTRGLPSRHMFYDAFNDIKDQVGMYVNVELRKTVGSIK